MLSRSVEVPDLRFLQRPQASLIGIEIQDVLVRSVNHADRPVPEGLE
jgi:hypothetical protein